MNDTKKTPKKKMTKSASSSTTQKVAKIAKQPKVNKLIELQKQVSAITEQNSKVTTVLSQQEQSVNNLRQDFDNHKRTALTSTDTYKDMQAIEFAKNLKNLPDVDQLITKHDAMAIADKIADVRATKSGFYATTWSGYMAVVAASVVSGNPFAIGGAIVGGFIVAAAFTASIHDNIKE